MIRVRGQRRRDSRRRAVRDNRCTQHCETPFDDAKYQRHMQRTTLEGELPIMAERAVLRPQAALV